MELNYYVPKVEIAPEEFLKMQEYIKDSINLNLKEPIPKTDYKEPKISVIIPCFNGESFIEQIIRNIQNQKMKEIEIIIVDDGSKDNSVSIVKKYQKEDPRIKLIINETNKGTLYSRNIGAINSKGKFIKPLDVDDLLIQNDLFNDLYEEAEKNEYDIIDFQALENPNYDLKINELNSYRRIKKMDESNCIVKQPELLYYLFIQNETRVKYVNVYMWNKLIKADLYKKAINFLGEKSFIYKTYSEDPYMNFIITKFAKKLRYFFKYGYLHIKNAEGSHVSFLNFNDKKKINRNIDSTLENIELYFNDIELDKNIGPKLFLTFFPELIKFAEGDTKTRVINLIDSFLNSPYVKESIKKLLIETKNIIKD